MKKKIPIYDQKAVYIGRRFSGSKVLQAFLRNNEVVYFSGIKRVWIGHTYACGKDSISTKPERLNIERIDNPEWEALDTLVDSKNAEKRAEKKISAMSKPHLKAAKDALYPLFKDLGFIEMRTLANYLVDEVYERIENEKNKRRKKD